MSSALPGRISAAGANVAGWAGVSGVLVAGIKVQSKLVGSVCVYRSGGFHACVCSGRGPTSHPGAVCCRGGSAGGTPHEVFEQHSKCCCVKMAGAWVVLGGGFLPRTCLFGLYGKAQVCVKARSWSSWAFVEGSQQLYVGT